MDQELPNFARLRRESPIKEAESVYPADSIPAWMTVFTGVQPARHGVLYVFDIFDSALSDLRKLSTAHLQGETFWDAAAQAGKKCVILHPILFHPAWHVNGLMVTKSNEETERDEISRAMEMDCCPGHAREVYGIPTSTAKVWGGHPGEKALGRWANFALESMTKDEQLARRIAKEEPWDLFFVYFNQLDIVQHRLWRFFDERDPLFEKDQTLSPVIPQFYRELDRMLGSFREEHPDAQILVLSDHGHKVRPYRTVNLGEHLRRRGFLGHEGTSSRLRNRARALVRRSLLATITGLKVEPFVIRTVSKSELLTRLSKRIYSSKGGTPKRNSGRGHVSVSTFAGVKSYPFGGLEVDRSNLSEAEYRKLCDALIRELMSMKTPDGQPLFEWVEHRDRRFPGPLSSKIFPDIVFELGHELGVGWEMYGSLFGVSKDHRVASGGHSRRCVFLLGNTGRQSQSGTATLADVAPTILDLLGLKPHRNDMDGGSVVR